MLGLDAPEFGDDTDILDRLRRMTFFMGGAQIVVAIVAADRPRDEVLYLPSLAYSDLAGTEMAASFAERENAGAVLAGE